MIYWITNKSITMEKHSITLDCRPGITRPSDYINSVIKDTTIKLEPDKPNTTSFGEWVWDFEISKTEWNDVKGKIYDRIVVLYKQGCIRYGGRE